MYCRISQKKLYYVVRNSANPNPSVREEEQLTLEETEHITFPSVEVLCLPYVPHTRADPCAHFRPVQAAPELPG